MALTGNEIIQTTAPDAAGHPAAVQTPYTTAQLAAGGLPPLAAAANPLTAAGTTRADALAITAQLNYIGTAAASTGVVLPAAVVGQSIIIFNAGASPIQVYGAGSDTIDGTAGATGVALANAKRCVYICYAAAKWVSAQLGVVSA